MKMDKDTFSLKFKIRINKDRLKRSDYQAIKFAEGELTEEEFAPIREQRRAWRAEINELEAQLEAINSSAE